MKLRTREGSLRLRLTRREVEALRANGRVVEHLDVGPGARLSWALVTRDDAAVSATFHEGALTVVAPTALVHAWCEAEERVGFEGAQSVGDGSLRILVEKDWSCLKPRDDEDDSDAYPHPAASSLPKR